MPEHLLCPECANGIKEGKIEPDELIVIHKESLILVGCGNCRKILGAISAKPKTDD